MSASPITAANLFAAGRITLDDCVNSQVAPSPSTARWDAVLAVLSAASAAAFAIVAPSPAAAAVSAAPLAANAVYFTACAVREWRAYVAARGAHLAAVAAVEAARRNLTTPEPAR
jgi:hypothetical protein